MAGSYGPTDPKTTNNKPKINDHPYKEFEDTYLWKRVNSGIDALVKNGDIKEATAHEYIVGYLCKTISLKPESRRLTRKRTQIEKAVR